MLIGISQKFKGTEENVVEGIRFIDWGVATKVQSNLSINKLTQLLLPVNKYVGEQVVSSQVLGIPMPRNLHLAVSRILIQERERLYLEKVELREGLALCLLLL